MKKTTLYLPSDLSAAYSALSRRQRRSQAEVMRDALREYAERQELPLPDWVGMVETDGEVNSTNAKDWLREHWRPE
ncbi:MAG TPA: CopG family transcriptional regulator [Thermomicrobiales bacterium]|jgi:predicted transcriptional regulator